jgi:NDP-sugar pyrophosphorylase family protein
MKARALSEIPVAIICGGLGTRLGELTAHTPKGLVDINGRPFLHWQLALLRKQGFREFVLCVGHLAGKYGAAEAGVHFSFEAEPLGTAGTIRNALPLLGPEFFTIYGDSYLECDPNLILERHRAEDLLGCVTTHDGEYYGLNLFKKEAFMGDEPDLKELSLHLEAHGMVSVYEMPNRFMEIGSPAGLEEVRNLLK